MSFIGNITVFVKNVQNKKNWLRGRVLFFSRLVIFSWEKKNAPINGDDWLNMGHMVEHGGSKYAFNEENAFLLVLTIVLYMFD